MFVNSVMSRDSIRRQDKALSKVSSGSDDVNIHLYLLQYTVLSVSKGKIIPALSSFF